jgi:tRNA A37 threonylcarbamoyladenosine dehydratase
MSEINWLERTELLVGVEAVDKLRNANVLVVGLGGVGSYAADFLCRAGVGKMTIVDGDLFDPTNKNRQLHALDSTVGKSKALTLAARMKDINSKIELTVVDKFQEPEFMWELTKGSYDFACDCIDSFKPKINFIKACKINKLKFISSMGAGGKLDTSKVKVGWIWDTEGCPLAQKVKKCMKKDNVKRKFPVVFSSEMPPPHSLKLVEGGKYKKSFYGTISYMPALFGLHMSSYAIKHIMEK